VTSSRTSGTETTTATTAYFDGNGAFTSAQQTQSTMNYGSAGIGPTVTSNPTSVDYGAARKIIGGAAFDAESSFIIDTNRGRYFFGELVKDHHSVVQGSAAIAGGVCILAEPCGAAATVGAFVVGAVDFAAEKFKLWRVAQP
jgi:hypothetical protein